MKYGSPTRAALFALLCLFPVVLAACGGGDNSSPTPQVSAANSTITAAPTTVTADGTAAAAITVILHDTDNQPYTGSANIVIKADPCTQCSLSYTNDNGQVTGTLSSTIAEDISLSFTVNATASPSTATVDFVAPPPPAPNILFVVLDDVGVDEVDTMGYGGHNPPATPNIDAIADAGVRFRNAWSMPECTPSRAMIFDGRYSFRNNILNVITSTTLANSQLSPYEYLTPKLLKKRGYESALFGKFHLGGPDNNPYVNGAPAALGWDYFYGFIQGSPYPIDTTAGGVAPSGTYSCGFVPDASQPNGANVGACYSSPTGPCTEMSKDKTGIAPGFACLQSGGIFRPNATCQDPPPSEDDFNVMNGYYVSPLVINNPDGSVEEVPPTDPRSRTYRTRLETDAAINWINSRPSGQPWMATVSYSAIHTPYQPPPLALLPAGTADNSDLDCTSGLDNHTLANQMIEGTDHGLSRLLSETGLATLNGDGSLDYHPESTNTWVIVIGDNGSYAPVVRAPFDPSRAKATVYQTGVWVPVVVAGPKVDDPGRSVGAMVNLADLFDLFAGIAGINVHDAVPATHILDAKPMMPYLVSADHSEIRTTNFTQYGVSLTANHEKSPPCVVPVGPENVCVELFPQQALCETEGGQWYGPGSGACGSPNGCGTCCDVKAAAAASGQDITLLADSAQAIRNDHYKLVASQYPECIQPQTQYEFYRINEAVPIPRLDTAKNNLLTSPSLPAQGLNAKELVNFNILYADMQHLLDSQPSCPGDGNEDMVVNQQDLDNWKFFSQFTGEQNSSWYDFNLDGKTDDADRQIIEDHMGAHCMPGAQ